MRQRHFVVPDDPVVKIGHVHRPVRPQLQIDRPEPLIVALKKSGVPSAQIKRAPRRQPVVVDAVRHRVADEHRVAIFGRKLLGRVVHDARDGRRAVHVVHHRWAEAQPVVRLAEARIIGPAQMQIDRQRFAIGDDTYCSADRSKGRTDSRGRAKNIPDASRRPASGRCCPSCMWIFQPSRPATVSSLLIAVVGVDPAVEPAGERAVHPVRVVRLKLAVEHLPLGDVARVAADRVQQINVRHAIHDHPVGNRRHADAEYSAHRQTC